MTSTAELASKTNETASHIKQDVSELGTLAKNVGQEQINKIQGQMNQLRSAGTEQARRLAEQVRIRPAKTLLSAAGIGFLFGLVMRKSGSRSISKKETCPYCAK